MANFENIEDITVVIQKNGSVIATLECEAKVTVADHKVLFIASTHTYGYGITAAIDRQLTDEEIDNGR